MFNARLAFFLIQKGKQYSTKVMFFYSISQKNMLLHNLMMILNGQYFEGRIVATIEV